MDNLQEIISIYKEKGLQKLSFCELKELRKYALWCGDYELEVKLLKKMRNLIKEDKVNDQELEGSAYI